MPIPNWTFYNAPRLPSPTSNALVAASQDGLMPELLQSASGAGAENAVLADRYDWARNLGRSVNRNLKNLGRLVPSAETVGNAVTGAVRTSPAVAAFALPVAGAMARQVDGKEQMPGDSYSGSDEQIIADFVPTTPQQDSYHPVYNANRDAGFASAEPEYFPTFDRNRASGFDSAEPIQAPANASKATKKAVKEANKTVANINAGTKKPNNPPDSLFGSSLSWLNDLLPYLAVGGLAYMAGKH